MSDGKPSTNGDTPGNGNGHHAEDAPSETERFEKAVKGLFKVSKEEIEKARKEAARPTSR